MIDTKFDFAGTQPNSPDMSGAIEAANSAKTASGLASLVDVMTKTATVALTNVATENAAAKAAQDKLNKEIASAEAALKKKQDEDQAKVNGHLVEIAAKAEYDKFYEATSKKDPKDQYIAFQDYKQKMYKELEDGPKDELAVKRFDTLYNKFIPDSEKVNEVFHKDQQIYLMRRIASEISAAKTPEEEANSIDVNKAAGANGESIAMGISYGKIAQLRSRVTDFFKANEKASLTETATAWESLKVELSSKASEYKNIFISTSASPEMKKLVDSIDTELDNTLKSGSAQLKLMAENIVADYVGDTSNIDTRYKNGEPNEVVAATQMLNSDKPITLNSAINDLAEKTLEANKARALRKQEELEGLPTLEGDDHAKKDPLFREARLQQFDIKTQEAIAKFAKDPSASIKILSGMPPENIKRALGSTYNDVKNAAASIATIKDPKEKAQAMLAVRAKMNGMAAMGAFPGGAHVVKTGLADDYTDFTLWSIASEKLSGGDYYKGLSILEKYTDAVSKPGFTKPVAPKGIEYIAEQLTGSDRETYEAALLMHLVVNPSRVTEEGMKAVVDQIKGRERTIGSADKAIKFNVAPGTRLLPGASDVLETFIHNIDPKVTQVNYSGSVVELVTPSGVAHIFDAAAFNKIVVSSNNEVKKDFETEANRKLYANNPTALLDKTFLAVPSKLSNKGWTVDTKFTDKLLGTKFTSKDYATLDLKLNALLELHKEQSVPMGATSVKRARWNEQMVENQRIRKNINEYKKFLMTTPEYKEYAAKQIKEEKKSGFGMFAF